MVCSVSYLFIFIADIVVNTSLKPIVVPGSPEVNKPFSIPCFHDADNQLVPKDARKFTDFKYKWESAVDIKTKVYPADTVSDPTRFKVHPITGEMPSFKPLLTINCKICSK